MENNSAYVAVLGNIRPIPGADFIDLADVTLNGVTQTQIVTSKGTKEGTKVVYFDSNLCLDEKFITNIDKLSPDYNKEGFKSISAYLSKGIRVKVIKLKGTISNGLVIDLEKVQKLYPKNILIEGDCFVELEGERICYKYMPPVKKTSHVNGKARSKKEEFILPGHFPEHIDTAQLLRNVKEVNPEDCIWITRKMHGTSSRTGNVLVTRKLNFFEKLLIKMGVKIDVNQYSYAYGSRRVNKKVESFELGDKNHYYSADVWTDVGEKYFKGKLHKGEVVFYEIVGYLSDGKCIQKIGKYEFNYGTKKGEADIYVYRITMTNEDGDTIEYSTRAVKERCVQLGVKSVQEYYYGLAKDKYPEIPVDENWHSAFASRLKAEYLEKNCWDCIVKDTPDEGIVLRREVGGISSFKLKSERFLNKESEASEADLTTDIEEEDVSQSLSE